MTTTTVTTKGQVVIPAEVRKRMNLKKGTRLLVLERKEEIVLKPISPAYFAKIAGVLQTKGKLTKALLEERAKDRKKEG
jgi:AbrB family looped-hinge helix DNA binding protein